MMRGALILSGALLLAGLGGCSSNEPVAVEYYQPAYRAIPPAPVYSRLMWSHLPKPIKPRSTSDAPYILPVVSFEMPDATFGEAIEALAQSMGYRWHYPSAVAKRKIRLRMEGTVEEVLAAIAEQAKVRATFDHQKKLVQVMEEGMLPSLPASW